MIQDSKQVFDADQLLELSSSSPVVRSKLLGLVEKVIETAPVQLRDARSAWSRGRIEESARVLHTMRGTIGTLGADKFAAASMALESAIRAQQVERVAGLFQAAEQALNEMLAAASAFLGREERAGPESARRRAPPESRRRGEDRGIGEKRDRAREVWQANIRDDIKRILEEIQHLKDDVKGQAIEQMFADAVVALPSCLVVEDDELIAHVLVHLLQREGYRVDRCADGREALQVIRQATQPPGLILLDVMLPYVDGFELIHVLREEKHWTAVPIIMLTAKQHENDIVRALDAGATDYVVKPFQPNELMARLRRILRKKG